MINSFRHKTGATKTRMGTLFPHLVLTLMFCLTLPQGAFAKSEDEDAKKTFNETVYEFVDSIDTLEADIKDLDLSVVKIVLYRPSRNQSEIDIPLNVVNIIESKLKNKLLLTKRLQIFECMECKMTHVSLGKDKLVMSKEIESNDRLKDLGKNLGVDGFLIWNLHKDDKNLFLDLSIIKVSNGMIVWNNQYSLNSASKKIESTLAKNEPLTKEEAVLAVIKAEAVAAKNEPTHNIALSMSILGYSVSRAMNAGGEVKVNRILAENAVYLKKTAISDKIYFGLGFTYFQNVIERDLIKVSGYYVYPLLEIQMGPYFEGNLSLLNFYVGEGEAFFNKTESSVLMSGVNIRFSKELFMNVGFINIDKKVLTMPAVSGYSSTVDFGGYAYELKCGYIF